MKKKKPPNIDEYDLLFPGEKELPGPEESIDKIRAYATGDPWALVREAVLNDIDDSPDPLTDLGTRCSSAWDPDWIATVNAAEARLGHRICGARTPNGTPCTLQSNHTNGRCRFHGGFDLTGAPKGNRNALLHGLYSRRLQICGTHCPLWETCPCSNDDVLALPPKERPTCPYEQTEYNAFVTDAQAKSDCTHDPDPLDFHTIHTMALLHVMTNRAAAALRINPLTETFTASTGQYHMETIKLNTVLQAFLRIAREYRAFRSMFDQNHLLRALHPSVSDPTAVGGLAQVSRQCTDTNLEPQSQNLSLSENLPTLDLADRFMRKATRAATYGEDVAMLDAMRQAILLDPVAALKNEAAMLAAYRPREGSTLPEDAVRHILKHMKIDPKELYPDSDDCYSYLRAREIRRRAKSVIQQRKRRPRDP